MELFVIFLVFFGTDWVFNIIKQIRLNSNKQLENKIKELEFHKIPSYEELLLEETVYCHSTDIENVLISII